MKPLPIAASTMTNACGVGTIDVRSALIRGESGLTRNDFEPAAVLDTWIGRVLEIDTVRVASKHALYDCRNNQLAQLALVQDDFPVAVEAAAQRYGRDRIGVFVGTSTSGILATELAFRAGSLNVSGAGEALSSDLYRYRHSMMATTEFVRSYLGLAGVALTISTACTSSAKVFGAAARAIAAGQCMAAVVGGVDSLALSTLFGFHSLSLLSRHACRPFAADRDGISIGEAAGFALLDPGGDSDVRVVGVGESSDAYHMSTPHPDGAGAAGAMRAALRDAQLAAGDIDYVNLHGTASRANDIAEDRALVDVFGTGTPVSSTKGATGHTLGAAGVTEALIAALALREQWMPGTTNCARVDPELASAVLLLPHSQRLLRVMTNSFGFGGTNCSLVLEGGR